MQILSCAQCKRSLFWRCGRLEENYRRKYIFLIVSESNEKIRANNDNNTNNVLVCLSILSDFPESIRECEKDINKRTNYAIITIKHHKDTYTKKFFLFICLFLITVRMPTYYLFILSSNTILRLWQRGLGDKKSKQMDLHPRLHCNFSVKEERIGCMITVGAWSWHLWEWHSDVNFIILCNELTVIALLCLNYVGLELPFR